MDHKPIQRFIPKRLTVQQLLDIVEAYNTARTNELRVVPLPFPAGYKNPLMDNLYDAANGAAIALALLQVTEVSLDVTKRGELK